MNLWPHQQAGIEAAWAAVRANQPAGLIALPTGTGKTIMFATFARQMGAATLILVHRDELVQQAVEAFGVVWPEAPVGVVKAGRNEWQTTGKGERPQVVVASVQSLHARRLATIPRNRFGLVIVDEAHHAAADSWAAVLDHFKPRFILGVTATPERVDGKGLAERFGDRPLYSYPLRRAIDDGQLVRLIQYAVETDANLDGVSSRAGDLAVGELADAVNTAARNRVVVEAYQKHAAGRRALAFTVDVQHAHDLCEAFTAAGVRAAVVSGETEPDLRRSILSDFRSGLFDVVCNCAVLTEGFDDPGISAVLMARPTCSRPLYVQCVGRGLRKAPNKTDCLVLDYVDNSRRHKLVSLLDLLGAPSKRDARGADVLRVVDADRVEAERQQRISNQRPLKWRLASICPWPELPTLVGYVASAWWHNQPATGKQLDYLRGFGLDVGRTLSKGEASYLIDRCRENEARYPLPATPKQAFVLRRWGLWRPGMSKREASTLLARAKSGQRVA